MRYSELVLSLLLTAVAPLFGRGAKSRRFARIRYGVAEEKIRKLLVASDTSKLRQKKEQVVPHRDEDSQFIMQLMEEETYSIAPTHAPITPPSSPPPTDTPTGRGPTLQPTRITNSPTDSPIPQPTDVPIPPPSLPPRTGVPTSLPTSKPTEMPSLPPATPEMPVTAAPSVLPTTVPMTMSPVPAQVCDMPQSVRSLLIRVVLNSVSDAEELDTVGSPQSDAMVWIVDLDSAYLCPEDEDLIARYVMAVFYFSTRGSRWEECSAPTDFSSPEAISLANANCNIEPVPESGSDAWLTPSHICMWGGVVCEPLTAGPVEIIAMEQNGLSGTIASELRQLSELKQLSLEDGVISGVIPAELSQLVQLEIIDLNFNLIGGSIPEAIYSLPNLKQLDLNDNLLTGTISASITDLSQLEFFQVENNRMTGTIPESTGTLTNLEVATFEENNFEGSMPESVCDLRDIGTLRTLTADCLELSGRDSPPFVACDCCTMCR